MPKLYVKTTDKVSKATLPPEALIAIATIIRAFAEIDDLVGLHISRIGQTTEGIAALLLGRVGISEKIAIALYISKLHGANLVEAHNMIFDADFRELLTCRNVLAHGPLLGQSPHGYTFLTNIPLDPTDGKLTREAVTFRVEDLEAYAVQAMYFVDVIQAGLKLGPLREKRFQQPLQPHRKASQGRRTGSKPQPRPQSSRAKSPKPSKAQRRKDALAKRGKK